MQVPYIIFYFIVLPGTIFFLSVNYVFSLSTEAGFFVLGVGIGVVSTIIILVSSFMDKISYDGDGEFNIIIKDASVTINGKDAEDDDKIVVTIPERDK